MNAVTRLEAHSMRPFFATVLSIFLVGCAGYTKIDGKVWDDFHAKHKERNIHFKLPRGYVIASPHSTDNYEGKGNYHYDVPRGTGVYGKPWGETTIEFLVSQEAEIELSQLVSRRMESDLRNCISRYVLGWAKIECEPPGKGYLAQFYLKQLYPNEYLYVITRIKFSAYKKASIRNNRLEMFKDILRTIEVDEP